MTPRFYLAQVGSPLHAELVRIETARRAAARKLKAFSRQEGCSDLYGSEPANYLFDFKTMDQVDGAKWAKVTRRLGRGRTQILFRPKLNTPEGKALAQRVKALPACPGFEDAINIIPGLHCHSPRVFTGGRAYFAHIRYYSHSSGLLIVSVPFPEVDAKTLAAYVKQAKSNKRHSLDGDMDAALWTPPDWLTELKEWQALQLIDQDVAGVEVAHG